jgi:ATP-dependent DNA helicase RecG
LLRLLRQAQQPPRNDGKVALTRHYSVPIYLRGRYYYRIGSVKQELTGAALNEFLLERIGKKWDSVPVPNVQIEDLSKSDFSVPTAIYCFRTKMPI